MRAVVAFSLFALASYVSPAEAADADADADVLKKFGMLGKFSVNCAAPPSGKNPYLIFAISPDGKITRTYRGETSLDATLPIRNLRLVAPNRLRHDETGRQSELTVTIVKTSGKIQTWHSVRADGTVLIRDGKFVTNGSPSFALVKCAN